MSNFGTLGKLFRYFPTKSTFDTQTKAFDDTNETYLDNEGNVIFGVPEVKWEDICFIEQWPITSYFSGKKIYTHGQFYNCSGVDDAITLSYALEYQVHGLADALDVAETIEGVPDKVITRISTNVTPENVIDVLNDED